MTADPGPEVHTVLILDVDGVVSPIRGTTAWGDDVSAGDATGPIMVSPRMCAQLDQMNPDRRTGCYWLTDWSTKARVRLDPFPGKDWPVIAEPIQGRRDAEEWAGSWWGALPWWKWWALDKWLTEHPHVRKLIWVDDHLADHHAYTTPDPAAGPSRGAWTIETALRFGAHVNSRLIAPRTHEGLTPEDLWLIAEEIQGTMG